MEENVEKLRLLLENDKKLARELKAEEQRRETLERRVQILEGKVEKLNKFIVSKGDISHRDFTSEEIRELHKTMSLSRLANYLNCSIPTVRKRLKEV
jgi:hypothetical protein